MLLNWTECPNLCVIEALSVKTRPKSYQKFNFLSIILVSHEKHIPNHFMKNYPTTQYALVTISHLKFLRFWGFCMLKSHATYMCTVWSELVLFAGAFHAFDQGGDGTIRLNVLEVSGHQSQIIRYNLMCSIMSMSLVSNIKSLPYKASLITKPLFQFLQWLQLTMYA